MRRAVVLLGALAILGAAAYGLALAAGRHPTRPDFSDWRQPQRTVKQLPFVVERLDA